MSLTVDRNTTQLFSVVGAAYVAERHNDSHRHDFESATEQAPASGIAMLWLVLYASIIGFSVVANATAGSGLPTSP